MQKKQKNGIYDLMLSDVSTIQDAIKEIDRSAIKHTDDISANGFFFELGKKMQEIKDSINRIKLNSKVLIEEKEND